MTESHLRYLLVAASAAAAGFLAACSSPHAPTPPGTSSSGAPTVSPAPTTATGPVPAPRLTDRLVLQPTRVTAGTPIKGWLVVTYRSRAPTALAKAVIHRAVESGWPEPKALDAAALWTGMNS